MVLGIPPTRGDVDDVELLPTSLDATGGRRLAAVLRAARGRHPVLIVGADDTDEATRMRIRAARTAAEHPNLAVVTTTLPPLAARVLVDQAVDLMQRDDRVGWVHAAVTSLERSYTAFAWMSRLSGLRRPAPTLAQHALSLLPGTAFLAVTHPRARIIRVRPYDVIDLPQPPGSCGAVVADAGGAREWIEFGVLNRSRARAAATVETTADAAAFWGTKSFTEVVLHPVLDAAWFAWADHHLSVAPCGWCGEQVATSPCPCCGNATAALATASGHGA